MPLLPQKMLPIRLQRVAPIALVIAASTVVASCTSTGLLAPRFSNVSAQVQVAKLNAPGRYQVSGDIALPNGTLVAVAALRYLTLSDPVAQNSARPIYSLLDYRATRIEDGQWEAELDLWQADTEGQLLEAWQRQSDRLDWSVRPAEQVAFVTIPTPTDDLGGLEQRLRIRQRQLDEALLRQTVEGVRYAAITYLDDVPLPDGATGTPYDDPQAINGGWGRRYLLQPEPANPVTVERPSERRTTAPATPEEFLR